jgi:hypothetical protein
VPIAAKEGHHAGGASNCDDEAPHDQISPVIECARIARAPDRSGAYLEGVLTLLHRITVAFQELRRALRKLALLRPADREIVP